jgi:site-specific recombinase XerD
MPGRCVSSNQRACAARSTPFHFFRGWRFQRARLRSALSALHKRPSWTVAVSFLTVATPIREFAHRHRSNGHGGGSPCLAKEGIVDLDQAVTLFLDHRRDKGVSDGSLILYRYWCDLWRAWRSERGFASELSVIDAEELRRFFRYLEHEHVPHRANPRRPATARVGMRPSSRDSCWRTLRALWNFLAEERCVTEAQRQLFKRDRVPRPRIDDVSDDDADEPMERAIDEATALALVRACGAPRDEVSARNRVLILMLAESGMRVSEICHLNDGGVDLEDRTARVHAKGRKKRFVFWGPDTAAALRRYLALRSGPTGGNRPLFRGCSSTNAGLRLTSNAVRGMLKRLARAADITLPYGAPVHGFRSGFAQRCLDDGVDGLDLQQLLGHADIRTTTIYTRRHPRKLRGVHRRLFETPLRSGSHRSEK